MDSVAQAQSGFRSRRKRKKTLRLFEFSLSVQTTHTHTHTATRRISQPQRMSRIPRPAVAEPENEPIPDSTNHKRTVDQAWSPPPPPLAPVDTNLKKKRIETNAASGDVRPPEQQKQQRIDSQQVPLDEVALWEATKAETGWDVTDCLEHKVGNARIGPVSISPSHPLTLSPSHSLLLPPSPVSCRCRRRPTRRKRSPRSDST